jgi:hypothetical protein
MSFGRNPHVAKAEAAELKAQSAGDAASYERAWRDAGRLWERAAEREADAKRRALYSANAERARTTADEPQVREAPTESSDSADASAGDTAPASDPDMN